MRSSCCLSGANQSLTRSKLLLNGGPSVLALWLSPCPSRLLGYLTDPFVAVTINCQGDDADRRHRTKGLCRGQND
ncbi:uncharacterized protein K452DRAFT_33654 [Aplosporella prunicola CBS 121167]|uniref:Uncharacterized protein n=1 Tax=Aplosporella prunicola CBS 121167 TaxID=1176127 RepID=A0A6A6BEN8_9PEZI|nr:uncharacterized protein K452DRAFT_33654 [Aplosporella prunicola CBS 121167]KAF2141775.1 hypothetical protein K452DRAFT_33654 [Aplosporella prunicola CBS 121167]